ncbi:Multidrug export protein AcrE [Phycisphaerales bacterium]|nr:Multidrug export protein AcrE [Phycisphaerales bacterium]
MKPLKSIVTAAVILVGLLATAGGLAFWKVRSNHGEPNQAFEPAETTEVVAARVVPWRPEARLVGTVISVRSVTVSSEVSGVVKEVHFESGAIVEAGQLLLTLDASTEQADLAASEANVRVMEAAARVVETNIQLWESNTRRLTQAVEASAASATELDTAKATLASARAQLDRANAEWEQAKARVEQVKALIEKKSIKAPFRAKAGLRNVHLGQYLAEGTVIVGLQGLDDNIYLDFALPQEQGHRVKPGDSVMATSAVLGEEPVRIEVVAIDAAVDTSTRNVRIRAVVSNKEGRLRPGMFVDISVPVGEMQDYIMIPGTAVRRASYGDHVFVIAPGDGGMLRAKQRFIKLGPSVGTGVIVLQGLAAGDEVAASGSFKLREGAAVNKAGSAPAHGAAHGAPESAPK